MTAQPGAVPGRGILTGEPALLLSRSAAVLAALSDPERLVVLTAVLRATGPGGTASLAELAETTRLPVQSVARDAVALAEVGLIWLRGDRASFGGAPLAELAAGLDAMIPVMQLLRTAPDLARYFTHGRLAALPVMRRVDDRRRLAEVLGELFDLQTSYTEAEVNAVLRTVSDDHASLRRFLVEERQLTRSAGQDYRRPG